MQSQYKGIQDKSEKSNPKVKRTKTFLVEGLTTKAKQNINQQQKSYMMQKGEKLPKSKIAALMLETATL